MNRKSFLKMSSSALGLISIPSLIQNQLSIASKKVLSAMKPKVVRAKEGKTLTVIGDIQTHKISGADTDNQIVEWVNNVDPGVGIPPHIHTVEDEIFRVLKGQFEIMVDGKTTVLEAGDVAFAPKNVVHSWKVVGTKKASMSTSAFPAGIEVMFEELSKMPPGPPDLEKLAKICGEYGITFV